jgi:hypothetical protein
VKLARVSIDKVKNEVLKGDLRSVPGTYGIETYLVTFPFLKDIGEVLWFPNEKCGRFALGQYVSAVEFATDVSQMVKRLFE